MKQCIGLIMDEPRSIATMEPIGTWRRDKGWIQQYVSTPQRNAERAHNMNRLLCDTEKNLPTGTVNYYWLMQNEHTTLDPSVILSTLRIIGSIHRDLEFVGEVNQPRFAPDDTVRNSV